MKKVLFGLLMLCIISCSKNDIPTTEVPKDGKIPVSKTDPDLFSIRVENTLDIDLENVYIGDLDFGTVGSGVTTEYIEVEEMVNSHLEKLFMSAKVGEAYYNNLAGYGFCGTPPVPIWTYTKGAITLKINDIDTERSSLDVDQIVDETVDIEQGTRW